MKFLCIGLCFILLSVSSESYRFKRAEEDPAAGCSDEDKKIIEQCKPKSQKHIEMLEKQEKGHFGKSEFEELAKVCEEEVECMTKVKCENVRKFFDQGTIKNCKLASCNAKLIDERDTVPCLKEYLFSDSNEKLEKTKECAKFKEHSSCIKDAISKFCGVDVHSMYNEMVEEMKC